MSGTTPVGRLAYTVKEVCAMVPMGRNKFYDEAKAGRLRVRRSGRVNLILADDLKSYLESLPMADIVGPG